MELPFKSIINDDLHSSSKHPDLKYTIIHNTNITCKIYKYFDLIFLN